MADAVTIRTLAKIAEVSTATVSLALRNDPRIRTEVRKRIQQIADENGYKPNPVVANLIAQVRRGRNVSGQGALGMVFMSEHSSSVVGPAVREWTAACEVRANQLGYGFDRFVPDQNKRYPEHLAKIIHARGIRGLIAVGPFPDGVIPQKFGPVWRTAATIVIGARPIRPAFSAVTDDHFSSAARAMLEVARLGYGRPALCLHADADYLDEHRFIGGISAEHVSLSPRDRIPPFSYTPDAETRFKLWVKQHRPDVILTLHAEIRDWLESTGVSTPEDIGLVHLDRTAGLSGWAGIEQRHDQIGFAAVDMLIGQMQRHEFGPPPFQKCMFVYGTWVPGETVREPALESKRPPVRKVAARSR